MRCLLWLSVSAWPPVLSRPNFSSDFTFTESLSPHHVRVHICVKIRSPPQVVLGRVLSTLFFWDKISPWLRIDLFNWTSCLQSPREPGSCLCPSPSAMMAGLCHGSGNRPWVFILAHKHLANWALSPPTSPSSAFLFSVISLVRLAFLHTIVPVKEFVSLDSKTEGKSHSIPYSHWHQCGVLRKSKKKMGRKEHGLLEFGTPLETTDLVLFWLRRSRCGTLAPVHPAAAACKECEKACWPPRAHIFDWWVAWHWIAVVT